MKSSENAKSLHSSFWSNLFFGERHDLRDLKQIVAASLKQHYRRLTLHINREYANQPLLRDIDLTRILLGGEGSYDAVSWAELTGDWRRGSTLLGNSIYVRFLKQYRDLGEKILDAENFEQTDYFKNALRCVQFWGDYFGQRTVEGIRAQARAFVKLYERIKNGDLREVNFPSEKDHAHPGSRPVVRETLTRNTYQIIDGHHRLAVAWVLGHGKASVAILPSPIPSGLQSLVLKLAEERKELQQPIGGPEFDDAWRVRRPCHGQFEMMIDFLTSKNYDLNRLSIVDLACSYGWFVNEFAKSGCDSIGVEANPTALNIGRIAYDLRAEQLVQGNFQTFLQKCDRVFDVVLLLGVLHDEALRGAAEALEQIFRRVDAITGSVLFFDIEQSSKRGGRNSLPQGDGESVTNLIKENTSFTQALRLGCNSDDVGCDNCVLFACCRL